jgi:putative ABC transport system permease protein
MLKNYLKTALRNLWRKKGSTAINIAGLSLGVAGSLILFILISRHSSYDSFHTKSDRIYRVVSKSRGNEGDNFNIGVSNHLPDAFRDDFPEAEEVAFTQYHSGTLITIPQGNGEEPKKYTEQRGVVYTQPSFFRIFDRKVLIGDAIKGLDDPNEAIISKKMALKYFGKEDAIGEIVKHDNIEYKVAAVMEDTPPNTDFPFEVMLSYITIKQKNELNGGWHSIWSDEQCYFLLKEGETIASLDARFPDFAKKYLGKDAERVTFMAQPLSTFHSDDRFGNYNYNTITPSVLLTLSLIAIFLILTACINFINLATAEAIKRSKEVGIRKSLGSTRSQLVLQFLGETGLVTLVSVLLAIGIAQGSLGFLNTFLEENLSLVDNPIVWVYLFILMIVVSLLSGLYPSFVVSAFNPVVALKNLVSNKNSSGFMLRRALVITQFFISQVFIIGTIVLISQMNYLNNMDLGFSKDAVINVAIPVREEPSKEGTGVSKIRTLRGQLETLSGVEMVSMNETAPSSGSVSGTRFRIEGKDEDLSTQVKQIDGSYVDLFKIEFVVGENVKDGDTATGFLVNQKLADMSGYSPQDLLGKQLSMWGRRLPVVGVVKNFNTVSLSNPIPPVVMMNRLRGYGNISVKLQPQQMQETIKEIQKLWEASYPEAVFEFEFLDEEISHFYDTQRRMSVLLGIFASMAIFIGCLGLFGLATFMANQKTKEIGIRKVLGASVSSIFYIFSKEFVVLILVGFVFAVPVASWATNKFLQQFEYKIEIGPMIFAAGIGISFLIAFITVGYRSMKAATLNPVDSLKCE